MGRTYLQSLIKAPRRACGFGYTDSAALRCELRKRCMEMRSSVLFSRSRTRLLILRRKRYSKGETSDPSSLRARYFLTLETEGGHTIIVERVDAGTFSWSENPDDLQYRRSLAKVTRSRPVTSGVTVEGMKNFQKQLCNGDNLSNKRFCQAMYYHAAGLQS